MAKQQIFDEEFKRSVGEKYSAAKEKLSDALLTEEGKLDTGKIGSAVEDTFKKAEAGVKDSYRRFNEEYVRDGHLDKEKVGEAANRTYRKAGRRLATGMTRLAEKLADKFGVDGEGGQVIDSELVTEEPAQAVSQEDFAPDAPAQEES